MKSKIIKILFLSIAGFALSLFFSIPVSAGSCSYIGVGGGTWNAGANWSGTCVGAGGIPADGDDVTIPNNTSTNNNIVGLNLNSINFTGSPGGTLSGNELTLSSAITSSFPHIINIDLTFDGDVTITTNAYNGELTLTGGNLIIEPSVSPFSLNGTVSGTGTISAIAADVINITGDGTLFSGDINITDTTVLNMSGTGWNAANVSLSVGATLVGTGPVGSVTNYTGIVSPGNPVGQFDIIGNIAMSSGTIMNIDINGSDPSQFDSIDAGGDIFLNDSTLNITVGGSYVLAAGESFEIISGSSISGTFDGLSNGALFFVGGRPLTINYLSNSVILSVASVGLIHDSFTATPTTPAAGQAFVVTSVWSGTGPTPTGTAELFNGSTSLGSVNLVGGVATFNVAGLPVGTYSFTVEYSGDINFFAAVSDPLLVTVITGLAETGINAPVVFIVIITLVSALTTELYYRSRLAQHLVTRIASLKR